MDQDELLRLLAQKDNQAYHYLYKHNYAALKTLANYYVRNDLVAEDLVQEVFISLLESHYRFQEINEVKFFLYSSLKKKCISFFRKKKTRDNYVKEILSSHNEVEYFWEQVLKEDIYATLSSAIKSLPPQCSKVMQFSLEGMKLSDIAKELQLSIDTVKEHRKNGKKKLLSILQDQKFIFWITWLWL